MKIFGLGLGFFLFIVFVVVVLLVIFISLKLIKSSKESTSGGQELGSKIRNSLSKARQQKFKAESKINRLNEWAINAITTTYSDLFPNGTLPYEKAELLKNYPELQGKYAEKITFEQADKCDNIVNGYIRQIEAEKSKIVAFDKIQKHYEELKEKVKLTKHKQKKQKKLDKHTSRLEKAQDDISGTAKIFEHEYNLEDLKKEVELKDEYINQLEQLNYKYGDDIEPGKTVDYKNEVDNILQKI